MVKSKQHRHNLKAQAFEIYILKTTVTSVGHIIKCSVFLVFKINVHMAYTGKVNCLVNQLRTMIH